MVLLKYVTGKIFYIYLILMQDSKIPYFILQFERSFQYFAGRWMIIYFVQSDLIISLSK